MKRIVKKVDKGIELTKKEDKEYIEYLELIEMLDKVFKEKR